MSTTKVSTPKVTNVSKLSKRPRLAGLVQPETEEQAAEQTVVPGPSGVVTRLSDVVPEHLRWLWPGRLPVGKLVLLDGDPGTGKSTIAIDWAARVSTGARWPDGSSCPKGDVVVLSAEDGLADTVRPRLDAAGGDPQRVHALIAIAETSIDGKAVSRPVTLADVDTIRKAITDNGALLMIVDVLMAYLPGKVDSHRDQDIRAVLSTITKVAEETGCTVLLLRHLNKANSGPALYRGGGSIGIVGAARVAFVVATDPDDETSRVLACTKSNIAAEPPSLTYRLQPAPNVDVARVEWGGESTYRADDLLHRPETDEDRTERDDAVEWLLAHLEGAGLSATAAETISAASRDGINKTTLHRARKRARVTTAKAGMHGGWTWYHPSLGEEDSEDSEHSSSQDMEPLESSRNLPAAPPRRKKILKPRKQKG